VTLRLLTSQGNCHSRVIVHQSPSNSPPGCTDVRQAQIYRRWHRNHPLDRGQRGPPARVPRMRRTCTGREPRLP